MNVGFATELPDSCQVVIVVLGHELQHVDEPHRRVEPWVARRLREIFRRKLVEAIEKTAPCLPESFQEYAGRRVVVARLVGLAVL